MCDAVRFYVNGQQQTVYFSDPEPVLPVLLKSGRISLVSWAGKKHKNASFPDMPAALVDTIKAGEWETFQPLSVKLPVVAYMQINDDQKHYWFDVEDLDRYGLRGMIARHTKGFHGIYIVTRQQEIFDPVGFKGWPKRAYMEKNRGPKNENFQKDYNPRTLFIN